MEDWKYYIADAKSRLVIKHPLWDHFPIESIRSLVLAVSPNIYVGENLYRAIQESNDAFLIMLLLHELTHVYRQDEIGVRRWWKNYLLSASFRLSEELAAADAELAYLATRNVSDTKVEKYLQLRSADLAGGLYFHGIKKAEAKDLLTAKWLAHRAPRE